MVLENVHSPMTDIKVYEFFEADAYPDGWPPEAEFARDNPEDGCIDWFKRTGRMDIYVPENAQVVSHREDGPAIEWYDGQKVWMIDGKNHRTDGPALIDNEGHGRWYIDDKPINSYAELQSTTGCSDADIVLFKLKYGEME